MRVLDLGTGLGHVAFELSAFVGPAGAVVGVDQAAAATLAVAEQRRAAAGVRHRD
jgi:ubiquinone/menaquinone biosynthesis C-methylase UbiE